MNNIMQYPVAKSDYVPINMSNLTDFSVFPPVNAMS